MILELFIIILSKCRQYTPEPRFQTKKSRNLKKGHFFYVSVNSKPDHLPRVTPRGFAHSSCPWGRVFAPPSCPGVLNQSKSSIILRKKDAIFALSLEQMGSSSFHMFIYARNKKCDLGPIHTITNTQRIRNYPGKLKFILVKISQDPGRLHGKHAKENQAPLTFLTTENFISGLPCSHECIYRAYSDLSSYAVNLPG